MEKIKTCITNPELVKARQYCEVLMNTKWMEMNISEPYVYLPAKIKEVNFKSNSSIPNVTLYIRKCDKRGNYWPVDNLLVPYSDIAKIDENGTIIDTKIIIFK